MSFKRDLDEIKRKKEEMVTSKFKDAEMLLLFWETKPDIVERLLPPPLEPLERPVVFAFLANYPSHSYGLPYYESALILKCQYKGEIGNYFLAMHLTEDRAAFAGREIFGFPKKLANVYFERKENEVYGFSERVGTKNLEVNVKLTGEFNDPEMLTVIKETNQIPKRGKNHVNFLFKHFPAPNKEGFDYQPWLVRQETSGGFKLLLKGEADITLKSTVHDPWAELEIVKVYGTMYIKTDNEMFPGEKIGEVDSEEFLPYSYIKWDWY
jgi:acetoacetate decarboxylase